MGGNGKVLGLGLFGKERGGGPELRRNLTKIKGLLIVLLF